MNIEFRVGQGYDVHAFAETGQTVVLGGVRIAHHRALQAHSDGDVLLHALSDALLGAAALGDIGHHFPDTDMRYHNADSRTLLREVRRLLSTQHWSPVNVDTTLIAQAPRIAPHVLAMRHCMSEDLALPLDAVSVKATTHEHLGALGRGEGIAAHAVVLIQRARSKT